MDFEILSGCHLFQNIEMSTLRELFKNKHYQVKKYSKESVVTFAGDHVDKLHIILEGSVRGEMTDFSGKTIKIEDRYAPDSIAAAFVFGSNNTFPVNVISNSGTELLVIPKDTLVKMLQENTQFLNNFLGAVSSRAQFLSNKIRFLSFKTIKGKFTRYLLQNGGKEKDEIEIKKTITEMAGLFGVTRPSLSRAISEMEKANAIKFEKGKVLILDRIKLNSFLD